MIDAAGEHLFRELADRPGLGQSVLLGNHARIRWPRRLSLQREEFRADVEAIELRRNVQVWHLPHRIALRLRLLRYVFICCS